MPDTINPRPLLSEGSSHPCVTQLGQLLAEHGHSNSVSEGTNPFELVDESILRAVAAFRSDNDLDEDQLPNVPSHERGRWIGPGVWEALLGQPVHEPEPEDDDQADDQQPEGDQGHQG